MSLTLQRQHQIWHLYHDQIGLALRPSDFLDLLVSVENPHLTLSPRPEDKPVWREGEPINFSVQSKSAGFVSLVNVYEDGKVVVMVANRAITANQPITLLADDLETNTLNGQTSRDLYVALHSPTPLDWSRYSILGERLEQEERAYQFHELIERLDTRVFTTRLLTTQGGMKNGMTAGSRPE